MKYLSFLIIFSLSLFAQGTWQKRSFGLPDSLIYPGLSKIDACDSVTAVLFCHPVGPEFFRSCIYLTTNAGESWSEIHAPDELNGYSITCGSIIDKNHIWFCTGEFAPEGAKIFATTDGGKTWIKQFENPSITNYLNYIEIFDFQEGVAMGDPLLTGTIEKPAAFLKTTDGGKNWKSMNSVSLQGAVSGDVWRRLDFVNSNKGYFCASGQIFSTPDGGSSFSPVNFNDQLSVLKFYNEDIGLSFITKTSGNSYASRTFDGGNTWSIFRFPIAKGQGWGTDIEYIPGDPSKIWGAQGKGLFFSSDTGRTWTEQIFIQGMGPGSVYDIEFSDSRHGWLIGDNSVWYTSNGDALVTQSTKERLLPSGFRLFQNYPNPFNPSTRIKYQIDKSSFVQLKVFSILGSEKEIIVSEFQKPGEYEITYDPVNMSGGIYFIQLTAGDQSDVRKIIYLK